MLWRVSLGLLPFLYVISCLSNDITSEPPNVAEERNNTIELGLKVVQLVVPVNAKMNDINDYREIVLPPYSNTRIELMNYTRHANDIGYAVVQLNAFEYNVTLSYNSTIVNGGHLTGQNLGLLMRGDGNLYAFNLDPKADVWVSLVLMLYNRSAPIPGGCNLEFPVAIAPVLNLTLTPTTVMVDTPPASVASDFQSRTNACGKARLLYESYYITMPSHDFSQSTYFTSLRKLISYANAKSSGKENTLHSAVQINRHNYDRQYGRGMVFVTAVIDPVHRGFALYVPAHTYACEPFVNPEGCYEFNIPVRVMAIVMAVLAAVEIVGGYLPLLIKGPLCMSFFGGLLVIYFLQNTKNTNLGDEWSIALLAVGLLLGLGVGIILTMKVPVTVHLLCVMLTGFLVVTTIFGTIHGNYYAILHVNEYIWLYAVPIGIVLHVFLPLLSITRSVIFGAIVMFYSISLTVGRQLHYPMQHLVRRAFQQHYDTVYADGKWDENDFVGLAGFVIAMVVCLFLRARNQPTVARTDFRFGCCCCRSASANDDQWPVITDGDDDVFESPASVSRIFRRQRRGNYS